MNVQELIDLLQTFPSDLMVVVPGMDGIGAIELKEGIRIIKVGGLSRSNPFAEFAIEDGYMWETCFHHERVLIIGETIEEV